MTAILNSEGLHKIGAIKNGVDAVYTNDTTKNKFGILAREVFKKFKALMSDNAIYSYKPRRDAINAIYSLIVDNVADADITAIVKRVLDVVD